MKVLSRTLLALYVLVLLWLVLFKFSLDVSSVFGHGRSLNLIPFADYSQGDPREMIYNFLVFVPFGLLLSANLKWANFWHKLAIVAMFSLAVEIIQFVCAFGVTDITDVITNTSGGLLGLILYGLNNTYIRSERLNQFAAVIGMVLLIAFISLVLSVQFSHQKNRLEYGRDMPIAAWRQAHA